MTEANDDPLRRFQDWMAEAIAGEPNDPNAMTLATIGSDGRPSARMVLLNGLDERGFVFYTNLGSRKAEELVAHPVAALLFHWKSLRRQVRIEGVVAPVTEAEADDYFASRPRLSQVGAWASMQSRLLPDRAELERRVADYEARFAGETVPRPPHWSGFRLLPDYYEFWQDMPFRLHDRTVWRREGQGWASAKIYP